eukprot:TRINITY_DN4892_c0_g1_i1.p1 TRINITY_DN4892_c0_g1~~TRINITY_DN4892_c0_g1_i1.p1  ORF type:complete len:819 (+),score=195.76 TRINITY_DN4892_c0_g1_i1:23-2458(+)
MSATSATVETASGGSGLSAEQEMINQLVEEEIQLRKYGNLNEGLFTSRQQQAAVETVPWESDRASLGLIQSSLKKSDTLTSKMVETLDSFDGRVQNLLTHINQVQDKTNRWKQIHQNITKSVSSIEDVLQKFEQIEAARAIVKKRLVLHAAPDSSDQAAANAATDALSNSGFQETDSGTEKTLDPTSLQAQASKTSPSVPGAGAAALDPDAIDLDSYLLQVDQLMELERYFLEHQRFQSAGDALGRLTDLIKYSSDHIYQFYDEILRKNCSPLTITTSVAEGIQLRRGNENLVPHDVSIPVLCLDKQGIVQLIPESSIRDLLKLMKRLQTQQGGRVAAVGTEKTYLQLYVERRAQFLQLSLQVAFNEASIARGYGSAPTAKGSAEPPTPSAQPGSKSVVGTVVGGTGKIFASMINAEKQEQKKRDREFLESATGYEKGMHLFLLYVEILLIICRSERALTETLVASAASGKSHLSVFAKIVGPSIVHWAELGDMLLKSLKRNPNRVYGVSVMLDVYGTLQQLLQLFDDVFTGCPSTSADELGGINTFWTKLTSTTRQVFVQFRDDIKADPMRQLPSDGTVSELSSMCINFLRHLFEFKEVLPDLLPSPSASASTKRGPLAEYIVSVLANLKENLDEKARKERNKTLANIFLLNNYYFVLKSLDGSGSVLGSEVGARAIQSYRGWVDEQRELYRSTFDPIMDYLDEDKYKMKDTKSLGSKDKTTLKSRFSGFNKDFEEAFDLQNRLFVPDDGLRTELRRELRARILPAYRSFLDRWGDGSFTKNPGKYVKISAEAMESMLNKFFDGALGKAK